MSKEPLAPEPKEPQGTGDDPSATPPKTGLEPVNDDDETVTITKADLKKLQAQRDGNYEQNRNTQARVALLEMNRDIDQFLGENKGKFPDVKPEDLYDAEKPEDFEQLALKIQDRIDAAAQRRLVEFQKAQPPIVSAEDRATLEKKLKKNPGSKSFAAMVAARLPRLT